MLGGRDFDRTRGIHLIMRRGVCAMIGTGSVKLRVWGVGAGWRARGEGWGVDFGVVMVDGCRHMLAWMWWPASQFLFYFVGKVERAAAAAAAAGGRLQSLQSIFEDLCPSPGSQHFPPSPPGPTVTATATTNPLILKARVF